MAVSGARGASVHSPEVLASPVLGGHGRKRYAPRTFGLEVITPHRRSAAAVPPEPWSEISVPCQLGTRGREQDRIRRYTMFNTKLMRVATLVTAFMTLAVGSGAGMRWAMLQMVQF